MTSVEFASKYAGTRFNIPKEFLPPEVLGMEYYDTNYYAQVVGYFTEEDNRIVIELEESSFRKYCWPIYSDVNLVVDKSDLFGRKNPAFLAIDYRRLKIPKKRFSWDEEKKEKEEETLPRLYTSRCGTCNEPARKFGRQVMCSNRACSTRSKLLKSLDIKKIRVNILRCPCNIWNANSVEVCKKRVVYSRKYDTYYKFTCESDHQFNISIKDLKPNDVLSLSVSGTDNSDRIWNGTQWETY